MMTDVDDDYHNNDNDNNNNNDDGADADINVTRQMCVNTIQNTTNCLHLHRFFSDSAVSHVPIRQ